MAIVTYNCTGCKPIDSSIIDVYVQLLALEQSASAAEDGRVAAEAARVQAESDRETAFTNDHNQAGADHSTYVTDHNRASDDHSTAATDHENAVSDRNGYNLDHQTAVADHQTAANDHRLAGDDHTRADADHARFGGYETALAEDHARAVADHNTASLDHSQAGDDHTFASQDHNRASADHSTAADDHALAVSDHGTAGVDHTASTSATSAANSAATRANNAAAAAEHMVDIHQGPPGPAGKAPVVGANGNWWTWDDETEAYVDSGEQAQGPVGATPDISIGTVTTGEPGVPASASMGGTAAAPVLNLTIPKGQKGDQGNTGSSVDYPYELVNNLTTNDATKGLSAAQGVVLDGKVSQLEAKVDGLDEEINGSTSKPLSATANSGGFYAANVGQTVSFTAHSDFSYMPYTLDGNDNLVGTDISQYIGKTITFVRSGADTSGASIVFTDDENLTISRYAMGNEGWVEDSGVYTLSIVIPTDTKYLYWAVKTGVMTSIEIAVPSPGLKDVVESNTARIDALEGNTGSIQPKRFPTLPYPIVKKGTRYAPLNDIYAQKKAGILGTIYVDSANGNDTTGTGAQSSPYKTLKKALTTYQNQYDREICILDNAIFYADDLYGESRVNGGLIINAPNGATLIGGVQLTFSALVGYANVYQSNDAGAALDGVVNMNAGNIDNAGMYKNLTKVASIADCETTPDSYYISGNVAYIHLSDASHLSNIVGIFTGYKVRFSCYTGQNDYVFLRNLNIIGNFFDNARSSSDNYTMEFFVENCIIQHSFSGDKLPFNSFDVVYCWDTIAGYSKADVFNVHFTYNANIANVVAVFMNCWAKKGGIYGLYGVAGEPFNNNLYTTHEGGNVMYLGCRGEDSEGPMVVDANSCRSVAIDCEVVDTFFTTPNSNIKAPFFFSGVSADASVQDCSGYDVRNNLIAFSEGGMEIAGVKWTDCSAVSLSLMTERIV